jgi:hypothetical protein
MNELLEVGAIVRHPQREDWGVGQVQSLIGPRATVNFENAGKVVINLDEVTLILDAPDWL